MSKKPFSLWTDQDLCDWFDGLSEDYIRSLIDLHDDHDITPRKAFHYVFGDLDSQHCTCQACRLSLSPVPAQESQSESVAAPAEVGQGQGTKKEDPREKLKALRLQIEQKRLASTGFDNPDYVLVRASDLRRVALYLSVALDRSKYSIGRTQAVQARNELLRIQSCMVTFDDLLRKVREQGA